MIKDFNFSFKTEIIFGKDSLSNLSKILNNDDINNVLLIYGKHSIKNNGIYKKISQEINKTKVNLFEISGCGPNPTVEFINKKYQYAKEKNIDLVLAAGGGSVIDASKAIALLLNNSINDIWKYKNKSYEFTNEAKSIGVVLTTAGTGSEVNGGFVISNKKTKEKIGFSNLSVRPKFAICNPEFTYSLSKGQTANNIVDIVSHLLEQFFSKNKLNNYLFDDLIIGTLKNIFNNYDEIFEDPTNYNARANIMLDSSISLSYLYSMGKELIWVLHNIEHVISGLYNVSHGEGLAMLLPGWIKYISVNKIYKNKTYKLSEEIFEGKYIYDEIVCWLKELNMSVALSEIIETKDELNAIAKLVYKNEKFMSKIDDNKKMILDILNYSLNMENNN